MYFVSTPVFISLLLRGHPVVPGTQRNKFLAKVYSHVVLFYLHVWYHVMVLYGNPSEVL